MNTGNTAASANDMRLAVLIDAENIPYHCLKSVMEEIAIYGTPTIKRIYGDWTSPNISNWKQPLLENAITPVQQYSYTQGKNSSDSAMIIDAMDILYAGNTDGFVLVSSDSDFTRLAIRLREAGQRVFGIGEKKTPNAFIVSCDKFIYIDVIGSKAKKKAKEEPEPEAAPAKKTETKKPPKQDKTEKADTAQNDKPVIPKKIIKLIADSIDDLADDNEWAYMGELGTLLIKKQPDFDHRNFGFKNLSAMVKSIDRFQVDFRQTADPNIKHPYVRDKES